MKNYTLTQFALIPYEERVRMLKKLKWLKPVQKGKIDIFRFIKLTVKTRAISDLALNDYTLEEVSLMKDYLQQHKEVELMKKFLHIQVFHWKFTPSRWLLMKVRIVLFMQIMNQFQEEVKLLGEMEKKNWSSKNPDSLWSAADPMNELGQFGYYTACRQIAKEYGFKPLDVFQWEYQDFFVEMKAAVTEADVNKRFNKLKQEQNK